MACAARKELLARLPVDPGARHENLRLIHHRRDPARNLSVGAVVNTNTSYGQGGAAAFHRAQVADSLAAAIRVVATERARLTDFKAIESAAFKAYHDSPLKSCTESDPLRNRWLSAKASMENAECYLMNAQERALKVAEQLLALVSP